MILELIRNKAKINQPDLIGYIEHNYKGKELEDFKKFIVRTYLDYKKFSPDVTFFDYLFDMARIEERWSFSTWDYPERDVLYL